MVTVAEPDFRSNPADDGPPANRSTAITGGPGIVAMGMSGKKVIGAGVWVTRPASSMKRQTGEKRRKISLTARHSITTRPCIAEKSSIVVESVAERLVQQMQTFGALLLSPPADTDKFAPPRL